MRGAQDGWACNWNCRQELFECEPYTLRVVEFKKTAVYDIRVTGLEF